MWLPWSELSTSLISQYWLNRYHKRKVQKIKNKEHISCKQRHIISLKKALDAMIWITIILIALYVVIKFAERRIHINSTILYADISDNNHRVFIQIAKICYGIGQHRFTSERFIDDIQITGNIDPQLAITWNSLEIYNQALQMEMDVPLTTRLNYNDAFILRRILRNEFNLLIFTRESTKTKFQLLSLQGSHWERINLFRRSILLFNAPVNDQPPAYV